MFSVPIICQMTQLRCLQALPIIFRKTVQFKISRTKDYSMYRNFATAGRNTAEDNSEAIEEFFGAVGNNDIERVRKLLQSGIDINMREEDMFETALHKASTKGYEKLVRFLVENEADVNAEDKFGELPLHRAADNNYPKIVQYLVQKKSDFSEDVTHLIGKRFN